VEGILLQKHVIVGLSIGVSLLSCRGNEEVTKAKGKAPAVAESSQDAATVPQSIVVEETVVSPDGTASSSSSNNSGEVSKFQLAPLVSPSAIALDSISAIAKTGPGEFVLYTKTPGQSWVINEQDGAIKKVETIFKLPAGAESYTLPGGDVWWTLEGKLARSNKTQLSQGGATIPGVSVALTDLVGADQVANFKTLWVDVHNYLGTDGKRGFLVQFDAGKLSARKFDLPESIQADLISDNLVAGIAEDGASVWFVSPLTFKVLQRRGIGSAAENVWVDFPIKMTAAGDGKLGKLAMLLAFDSQYRPKCAGGILQVQSSSFGYYSKEGTQPVLKVEGESLVAVLPPYTTIADVKFDTHISLISKAACDSCHTAQVPKLDSEAAWKAAKNEILQVVSIENKGSSSAMPPPSSKYMSSINDEQRKLIIDWLTAETTSPAPPPTTTTPPPAVALTFAADVKPKGDLRCVPCHNTGANNAGVQSWWDARLATVKTRINNKTMPPAASAQAQAMTQAERDLIVKWVDQPKQ
jgi:cytochrome c5